MIRTVLSVQLQEASAPASPIVLAGFDPASEAYDEMTVAARHLVLAQNAWDDHVEAGQAEMQHPALGEAQGGPR